MPNRFAAVLLTTLVASAPAFADAKRDALWAAVRKGDAKAVEKAIKEGADPKARNEYGVTALWLAAAGKSYEVVETLVKHGADVNARDDIWYQTPLSAAVGGGQAKTVELLLKSGAKDVDTAVVAAAAGIMTSSTLLETILKHSKPSQEALNLALSRAMWKGSKDALVKAGAKPLPKASEKDRKAWAKWSGAYESDGGSRLTLGVADTGLTVNGAPLKVDGPDRFEGYGMPGLSITVEHKGDEVTKVTLRRFTAEYSYYKFKVPTANAAAANVGDAEKSSTVVNWPSFRGPDGTGVADGQNPPVVWSAKKNENIRWKTPIPGLGHSCPVVWGDRVFLTTAISKGSPNPSIRVGNYGDVESVNDVSEHTWQVLCLDRGTGKILWTKTAYVGKPKIRRHLKGSQANCTPATDGRHVVACFGSEGLYCYDFDGKLLWKRDLSTLDSSFSLDKEYEWGFGNSPVLYDGKCILQCDLSHDSFIAAFSLTDGYKVWSTPRDEIPSWSSPVVWKNSVRTEIVTNAAQYARGYDPKTGVELWRLAKKSEVTVPTPVLGKDLAYISSGNRPIQPIIAVRPGAKGDVSLKSGQESNSFIAWSTLRGGPYMPTPILYRDYFYTCSNSGVVACYEAATGKEVYKQRIGGGSYTASPVASDGRLYFTSEQGEVRVVKAGPKLELLAVNAFDDYCMPTPAVSKGSLIVRSQHFLWSVGKK